MLTILLAFLTAAQAGHHASPESSLSALTAASSLIAISDSQSAAHISQAPSTTAGLLGGAGTGASTQPNSVAAIIESSAMVTASGMSTELASMAAASSDASPTTSQDATMTESGSNPSGTDSGGVMQVAPALLPILMGAIGITWL